MVDDSENLEALVAHLDAAREPRARASILVQIARAVESAGDGAQAFDALVEAWRADPTYDESLTALEASARALGRLPEVITQTEILLGLESDSARALARADAMVRWLTRETPNTELAIHYLERIRVLDPTHWAVHLFEAAVSREHGDFRRELEELDRAVLSARRADDRVTIHLLMAARYGEERSFNLGEAKKHFDAAVALDPRSMEALRGLEAIHARAEAEDWAALCTVLERQVEVTADDDERDRLLLRVADMHEQRFLRPELAAACLERVVARSPSNADALASLERCYRAARAWPQLVSALERGAARAEETEGKRARLEAIAEVHESKLGELDAARRAWERVAELAPADPRPFTELARLSERIGDIEAIVRHKSRLAELTEDPAARARAHFAIAQLVSTSTRDAAAARAHLERAVVADPSLAGAWNVLLWMAKDDGDWERVARYIEARARAEGGPRQRGRLFAELAGVRATRLGDPAGAAEAYEAALDADPQNEAAAQALLERYVSEGRWDEAAELHEIAIRAADRDQDVERRFSLLRLGRAISIALGHTQVALASALAAYELRPSSPEAQAEVIASAAAMREDPEALARARDVLESIARTPAALSPNVLAGLGDLLVALDDRKAAYATYGAALDAEPAHRAALAGLAALCALEEDVVVATALKRRLAHSLEREDERFAMLMESGDALAAAGKLELAVEAYEEARAVRPRDRPLLHVLVGHYATLERWAELSSVLRSVADADDDDVRRGKTLATMAQIALEKLGDPDAALKLDEEALDRDASRLEAFERVVTTLTERRDWGALDSAYRRMIARAEAAADAKLRLALYHQAGLVCRDRLGDRARAITYFRVAAELDPANAQVRAILVELLEIAGRVGDALAVALEHVRSSDALAPEPWGALFDVALQAGAVDRAWCAASVLEHLGALDAARAPLYLAHRPMPLEGIGGALEDGRPHVALSEDARASILHPELDPRLTALLAIAAPAFVELQLSRLSLRQRMSHPGPSLPRDGAPLARAVERAAEIFGLTPPRVHARKGPGPVLAAAPTRPPSLLATVEAFGATPPELVPFIVGKRVFELSPPLLARALCPSVSELSALVTMTVNAVLGQGSQEPLHAHLKAQDRASLAEIIRAAQAEGGELDVRRWSRLADLSASRAGLLLAGDARLARAALAHEPQSPGDLPVRDQMRELSVFMVSDAHAALRRALRVAVGG